MRSFCRAAAHELAPERQEDDMIALRKIFMFDHMSKTLGQPIVVENRPGAGGNSGTADATKAAADGYTIVGSGSGSVAANVTLYKHLDYDPQKDLAIISPFASFTIIVAASSKLPV